MTEPAAIFPFTTTAEQNKAAKPARDPQDALAAVLREITLDAAARSNGYLADTVVPEGGE